MKILLGVNRSAVAGNGTVYQMQRAEDTWEIDVPDDGSEFLGRIWMIADGMEVLSLPLAMGPAISRLCPGDAA